MCQRRQQYRRQPQLPNHRIRHRQWKKFLKVWLTMSEHVWHITRHGIIVRKCRMQVPWNLLTKILTASHWKMKWSRITCWIKRLQFLLQMPRQKDMWLVTITRNPQFRNLHWKRLMVYLQLPNSITSVCVHILWCGISRHQHGFLRRITMMKRRL